MTTRRNSKRASGEVIRPTLGAVLMQSAQTDADPTSTNANENYAFVINVASIGAEALTLAPGHTLRRATPEEMAVIKKWLEHNPSDWGPFAPCATWECSWPATSGKIEQLPESEWRYFVIAFRGTNTTLLDIQTAADLATVEPEIGFEVLAPYGFVVQAPGRYQQAFAARITPGWFLQITEENANEIAAICVQIQQAAGAPIDSKGVARRVGDLKNLSSRSPFRFLGYFAILESVLTHVPKPTDPYDSITRQIKGKLALLDNRWSPKIDYSPFSGAAAETVWTKMYAYRSVLAHGGTPDFKRELALLRDHAQAYRLIKETVKAVVRQTLIEPQLLSDLREC